MKAEMQGLGGYRRIRLSRAVECTLMPKQFLTASSVIGFDVRLVAFAALYLIFELYKLLLWHTHSKK